MNKPFLTVAEACEFLGISERSLYNLKDAGKLTTYRLFDLNRVYFKRSDLEQCFTKTI